MLKSLVKFVAVLVVLIAAGLWRSHSIKSEPVVAQETELLTDYAGEISFVDNKKDAGKWLTNMDFDYDLQSADSYKGLYYKMLKIHHVVLCYKTGKLLPSELDITDGATELGCVTDAQNLDIKNFVAAQTNHEFAKNTCDAWTNKARSELPKGAVELCEDFYRVVPQQFTAYSGVPELVEKINLDSSVED